MMRRSPIKPGKGFSRKVPSRAAVSASSAGLLRVDAVRREKRTKHLKTPRTRMTPIRKVARGQDCALMIPGVCNQDPDTTVLCHSNSLAEGKGIGLKAPDLAAAFGCAACHDVLDGRRARPAGMTLTELDDHFRAGVRRTHIILARMGLIEDGTGTGATEPAPEHFTLEQQCLNTF